MSASWASLVLAGLGLIGTLVIRTMHRFSPFEFSKENPLEQGLPRAVLTGTLVAELLALLVGGLALLLIRRKDIAAGAVPGILARALVGVAFGAVLGGVLYSLFGHLVVGS